MVKREQVPHPSNLQGPCRRRGWGGGGGSGSPHFLNNKRNLWWNKNISLADLTEVSKFMIRLFRSYITMVRFKMIIFTKLHKHKQWSLFFIKVLKSPLNYDFFQWHCRQLEEVSGITSAEHDKWISPDLQACAGRSCNHRRRKRSFLAARRLKTWSR